jgi:hypothetical protein
LNPTFRDPSEQAIYRYLTGAGEQPPAGQAPTPACMPKRRHTRHGAPSAADIARAEGLDLGDLPARPSRSNRPAPLPRQRRTAPSVFQTVLDIISAAQPRLPHQQAVRIARSWSQVTRTAAEATEWIAAIGWERPTVVGTLRQHHITADMLNTPVAGTPARIRLRNGESADSIAAALRDHGTPPQQDRR